ncbi:MAG: sugar phosphate isomerase/epimerase [Chthoniobacterales bacterium]|nr:sugar phosphate isomerase/epimerase [Chthoniobacterales bacterium]
MTSWPIGLSTGCFCHRSILDCLPLIRESGFSLIEVCSSPEHLDFRDLKSAQRAADKIAELGMEAYSFHAPFAPEIDIASSNEAQRVASVAEIFKAAEAAALLRVHYFVMHPGPENPAPIPPTEQLPRMRHVVDSLSQIARRCQECGIMCVLENKLPHLLFGNTSDILWILDGINSAGVGVCLDTGHAFLAGDMHNLVLKLAAHLRMVHAHDNDATNDNHWPPGDGRIHWDPFLRDLVKVRFRGAFVLEIAGHDDPAVTLANARRGRSYLRDIARRIALEQH